MRVLVLTVSTRTCGGYSVRPHQTLTVLLIYYIMSTKFDVNGKQIAHKDLNTVRDFFTDEQWDCIYDALSEYQDFPEKEDLTRDTLSAISQLFASSY